MKTIKKIVLTGGPCAGKTTAISWIVNYFSKKKYKVLISNEVITALIKGGACPWELKKLSKYTVKYQMILYKLLKEQESAYEEIAKLMDYDKILLITDRGSLDAEAYLSMEQQEEFHAGIGRSSTQMMDDYDAVFHLMTAAKGALEFYTTENNEARTETPEEATELDNKTLAAWTGHPHLRIIDNSTDLEKKMLRLIAEIASFLGEPEPFEIEKKFLIEYPDIELLESMPNCQKVEILQFYLNGRKNEEVRLRQRGDGLDFVFTKTIKQKVNEFKRVEKEKKLSKEEYIAELMNLNTALIPIKKTRYCLSHLSTYLEIDVYDLWDDKAILEIELADENDEYKIPDFIKVIKDVTEVPSYKNVSLSKWANNSNYQLGKTDGVYDCFKLGRNV